jgi:3',5'-cyclic AMP phosphodiesterase CpdA
VIRYQPQLWQAFKSEVLAANPDALILSGDLSLNGEKANHLELQIVAIHVYLTGPHSRGDSGALYLQSATAGVLFCLGYFLVKLPRVSGADVLVSRNGTL